MLLLCLVAPTRVRRYAQIDYVLITVVRVPKDPHHHDGIISTATAIEVFAGIDPIDDGLALFGRCRTIMTWVQTARQPISSSTHEFESTGTARVRAGIALLRGFPVCSFGYCVHVSPFPHQYIQ